MADHDDVRQGDTTADLVVQPPEGRDVSPDLPASSAATTTSDGKHHDSNAFPDAEANAEKLPTEQIHTDPNIVDWDGPDDPGNPINFSARFKIINVGIISALTFITPLASSMFAPGVPELMAEFHSQNELLAGFVVSVYVLGFAVGPLILAPASELYGRAIIYHICNVGFVIFSVACALSTDIGMLVVFRFFQGCFGVAPVTNGRFDAMRIFFIWIHLLCLSEFLPHVHSTEVVE